MDKSYSAETVLSQVHEGMTVYDIETRNIGVISDIYLGSAYPEQSQNDSDTRPQPDRDDIPDGVMAAGNGLPIVPVPLSLGNLGMGVTAGILPVFAFEDVIPAELRSRLMTQGFIQIRGNGILGASRYVTTDQITSVHDEAVYLNVSRGQLNQGQ